MNTGPTPGRSQVLDLLRDRSVRDHAVQVGDIPVWMMKAITDKEADSITQLNIRTGAYCFCFEVPQEVSLVALISEPSDELWEAMEEEGYLSDPRFEDRSLWLVIHVKHASEEVAFDAFWMIQRLVVGTRTVMTMVSMEGLDADEQEMAQQVTHLISVIPAVQHQPAYKVTP